MRKSISLLLAIALFVCAMPIPAYAALTTPAQGGNNRLYTYSTASTGNYNSVDLEIAGNTVKVRRRAYKLYQKLDVIEVRQGQSLAMKREAQWAAVQAQTGVYGYEIALDFGSLANGSYTVLVETRDTYVNVMAEVSLVKDYSGCYFPQDSSMPKQYNNAALQRLEGGSAPDDFAELKELYGQSDTAGVLNSIQAKAGELTRGLRTDRDKALAINRWIVENIAYDMDADGDAFLTWVKTHPDDEPRLDNPLQAFSQRYALCYGFARLTVLMMGYAGVDCVYITGRATTSPTNSILDELDPSTVPDTMTHAWNAVKIDGAWHFIDTSKDALNYYYRTSKELASTGYRQLSRDTLYQHVFPSLNHLSKTHIALRLGVKNKGTKLSAVAVADGWLTQNGKTYYYLDGVKIRGEWKNIGGSNYYFDAAGAVAKGWQLVDGYWRYFDDAGAMLTGRQELTNGSGTQVYQFDANGCLTADDAWVNFEGANRYYQGKQMLVGWQYTGGGWRYFDETGAVYQDSENPLTLPEGTYRFNEQGILQNEGTGWVTFNGQRHYMVGPEALTGWQQIGGSTYYLAEGGTAQTGWGTAEGKSYYFGDNGVVRTGWQFIDGSWYYIDREQGRWTGVQAVGSEQHYFDSQGRLSTGGWVNIGNAYLYYADSEQKNGVQRGGKMLTGWRTVDGKLRFFDRTDGKMYTGKERMYNDNSGAWYTFDSSGVATKAS